ncbi:MAG: metallophosphoesterase, partial [Methanomassiliicoccaceae archaeon]|nr:metallophosphoesterase [Methanomassiliicoccaceae archaeon]
HGDQTIIDKLDKVIQRVDMAIVCGDIGGKDFSCGDTLRDVSVRQKTDAARLVDKMRELAVHFRFILGNDDWFDCTGEFYLNAAESVSGYSFVPFEFVLITPFSTNREVNDNKISYELSKLNADERTVIVAHMPPRNCGDMLYNGTRVGSRAASDWIADVQPRVWLCGHIHENYSVNKIGNTLVFNCACDHLKGILRGWIIDLDSMEYESVRI